MLVTSLLLLSCATAYVKEAADGSVFFNNCNDHGDCRDYSCHCWQGYHGDDCGSTFITEGQKVVPILSAGHYNLTSKNFTSAIIKNKLILVGFSAYSCHRCITVEPEYEVITQALALIGVPFARSDVNKMKSIALEHEASELPALVLFQKVCHIHHILQIAAHPLKLVQRSFRIVHSPTEALTLRKLYWHSWKSR